MKSILLSGPAIEPVSLAQAKSWLRLDANEEDDLLVSLILSARLTLEAHTRRYFVTQSWRMILDSWPATATAAASSITTPFAPFQRAPAIRVYDRADIAHALPSGSYSALAASDLGRVTFFAAPPTPGRATDGIEIDIVAGYGDQASDTPEPIRCAMLMLLAYWYENRGDAQATNMPIPPSVSALVHPFRRERLI